MMISHRYFQEKYPQGSEVLSVTGSDNRRITSEFA